MFRRTIAGAAGLLMLFHLWLLSSQWWDGKLFEPGLLLRWMIAAGLVGALIALRRTGAPILWGRKAVSVWLLAALLHGPTVAAGAGRFESLALPEAVTAVIEIAAAAVMLGLGLALLAAFRTRLRTTFHARDHARLVRTVPRRDLHRIVFGAPRPPPLQP
jgi:hypothetical protein